MKVQAKVHNYAGDVSNTCDFQIIVDFFFQSSMQPAGVIHLSGKFGRMIDKVDHPACSTVKVCAFMRVDACHFPEFSCYQCSF